jgi:ArsR family transcriptional regulator
MQNITNDALCRSVGVIKALADPIRLRLLNLLAGRQEICVCHLHDALELPQPTVSRHLAYLRKSGLVAGRKEGLWVYYRLARPASDMHRLLLACVGLADAATFERDRERLGEVTSCCNTR